MKNLIIPTTVIDGFFDDPDAVRELALKQDYFSDPLNMYPGKRSKPLHEINLELFQYIHNKFLNIFYPDSVNTPYSYNATAAFQLIDSGYKAGWVHYDQELITLLIYLNKNPNKEGGTSIFSQKIEGYNYPNNAEKKKSFFGGLMSEEEVEPYRLESNNRFQEEIVVKNKYNRLFAFDSHLPHGVNDFTNDEPRLTLVSFIHVLQARNYPIHTMNRTHQ